MLLGERTVSGQAYLVDEYQSIARDLGDMQLCSTLFSSTDSQKLEQCRTKFHGLMENGLT